MPSLSFRYRHWFSVNERGGHRGRSVLSRAWCLALGCLLLGSARAGEFGPWRVLFDGSSTEAFRAANGDGFPEASWRIEGENLVCVPGRSRGGVARSDIVTKDLFEDFELRWEWRISPRGESGLKYFLQERPPNSPALFVGDNGRDLVGHEYQMLDDERHPDVRRGLLRATASLYDVFPRVGTDPKPTGQWNESRLVVQGNLVEHWLNDVKVLEYELGTENVRGAFAKSKFKKVSGLGEKRRSAVLLEDKGTAIWFRHIRVREWRAD